MKLAHWMTWVLFAVALTGEMARAQKGLTFDSARDQLENYREEDGKLRNLFREVQNEHKKMLNYMTLRNRFPTYSTYWYQHDRDAQATKRVFIQRVEEYRPKQEKFQARLRDDACETLSALGVMSESKATRLLIDFEELHVFDSKMEVDELRVLGSFIDQKPWLVAARALGKRGVAAVPELKSALKSTRASVRYAAALACGEIGKEADTEKDLYAIIAAMKAKALGSHEDRSEKDKRVRIVEDALKGLRPDVK